MDILSRKEDSVVSEALRIAHDTVLHKDVEVNKEILMELMRSGRQVDFVLTEQKSDDDGYVTWDVEFWSHLHDDLFIVTYSYKGKALMNEFNRYNSYDMANEFQMHRAKEIRIS